MMTAKLNVTMPTDLDIVMTRDFNAPPELLFRAYTEPTLIPRWWGLRDHKTTVDKMDVRPGGAWRFVCTDPDGNVFAFRGQYQEIVPNKKIAYTFEFEMMAGHIMTETVSFQRMERGTRVTTRSAFATKDDRDGMVASGMEKGAAESCDRLEELLQTLA